MKTNSRNRLSLPLLAGALLACTAMVSTGSVWAAQPPSKFTARDHGAQRNAPARSQDRTPARRPDATGSNAGRQARERRDTSREARPRQVREDRPATKFAAPSRPRRAAPQSPPARTPARPPVRTPSRPPVRVPARPRAPAQRPAPVRHYRPVAPRHYVPSLPLGYLRYQWNGRPYYYSSGRWYRPWGSQFAIVAAPVGLFVSTLPGYHTSFWFGGSRYFFADETYYLYEPARRGYVVVSSPYGTGAAAEEATFDDDELYVYPARGQSEQQQADDHYECHRWAVGETGYDPVQGNYDPDRRSDYLRALGACLTARGYTVG